MKHQMYDIHMHLVPGVDDGAADMDMAKNMLEASAGQGVCGIIATPHSSAFFRNADGVRENYRLLQDEIKNTGHNGKLYLGCEIYCEDTDMDRVLSALESGQIPTMNGTEYVLTEFSPWVERSSVIDCADQLLKAGFIPIIAHAERYYKLRGDLGVIEELKNMGCRIQINVYSVFEEQDVRIKDFANCMLANRQADFLGSDAHRSNHRPPRVETGLKYLYGNYEKTYIDHIALENPRRLLIGEKYGS